MVDQLPPAGFEPAVVKDGVHGCLLVDAHGGKRDVLRIESFDVGAVSTIGSGDAFAGALAARLAAGAFLSRAARVANAAAAAFLESGADLLVPDLYQQVPKLLEQGSVWRSVDQAYMECKNGCMATPLDITTAANRPDYAALYLIAEGQRGYFMTHQAHQAGISDRLLSHWTKTGRFHRVAHGIYRMRDFPSTPREELMIPLLWAGSDSALSHETALELYGLADVLPTTTHLRVPDSFTPRRHGGITLHRRPLTPDEIVLRDDLRLTTVERTLVDSFQWGTDRDQLLLAVRQAVERGLVNVHRLRQVLDEAGIADYFDPALTSETAG